MSSVERSFTFETRLPRLDYFEEFARHYNHLVRVVWHDAVNGVDIRSNEYRKNMRAKHDIFAATENAIIILVCGRLNACLALEERRRKEMGYRLKSLEKGIADLTVKIESQKPTAYKLSGKDLQKYQNLKKRRHSLCDKRNRISQCLDNPIKPRLVFGTKAYLWKQYNLQGNGFKSYGKWLHTFEKKRDSCVYYIGDKRQTYGNPMVKLVYDEDTDKFALWFAKEKQYRINYKDRYIYVAGLTFKSKNRGYLIWALEKARQGYLPMSYRILRRGKKWYLQVMFTAMFDVNKDTSNGAIGVDFNNGFLSVVETDKHGNIAKVIGKIPLEYHGMGNKAKNEMLNVIKMLVLYAKNRGKPIVVENLNFSNKKCEAISKHGRKYNQMLHRLDYARFREWVVNTGMLYGVGVLIVNPAYTTLIAERKYCYQKKLNKHDGAAYVIARRGQGYHDHVA